MKSFMKHPNFKINNLPIKDIDFEKIDNAETLYELEQDILSALEDKDIQEDLWYFGQEYALKFESHKRKIFTTQAYQYEKEILKNSDIYKIKDGFMTLNDKKYKVLDSFYYPQREFDILEGEMNNIGFLVELNHQKLILIRTSWGQWHEATFDEVNRLREIFMKKINVLNQV